LEAKGEPMSPEKDFDINAWESGKFYDIDKVPTSAPSTDFDVNAWEKGTGGKFFDIDNLNPTSVAGRPQIQPPQVNMQEDLGPAPAGKLSGLPGVNPHTPSTKEGIGDVALAASPMAGPMVLAMAPEVVTALSTAAAQHPLAAKVIAHGLEAAGLGAGWKIATKLFGE
jgi:hypothetical protein